MLRYKLVATDRLILQIGESGKPGMRHTLIDALKERLAHQDGSLEEVDWSGLELNDVVLSSCRLLGARFVGTDLRGAYFGYSQLNSAIFVSANLGNAHFREAELIGADFTGAILSGANFARANLQRASFAQAELRGANFWRADLRGADLLDARLTGCCLGAAIIDASTRLHAKETGEVSWPSALQMTPQD